MRSLCLSEAMILSTSRIGRNVESPAHIKIRKGGQISSISLAGVLSVQRSRRSRRSGDSKCFANVDTHVQAYSTPLFL
jgi:hypothetical protein